jgi:hypothetical protein
VKKLYQPTLIQRSPSQQLQLSLNIEKVDSLFPYFTLGDFALLHGSYAVQSIVNLLCVRAQLPYQLGGLETNTLFVDGGNSFRLYDVSAIAQSYELDPRAVLERIFISRAFTAYHLTSLILDKLQTAIETYDSKLVILSNFAQLYLDKDVPKKEAQAIFIQLTIYLSNFAKENKVVIVTTHPPCYWFKGNRFFKEVLWGRANIVASIKKHNHRPQFVLEKHPHFNLGKTELPSPELNLTDFLEA